MRWLLSRPPPRHAVRRGIVAALLFGVGCAGPGRVPGPPAPRDAAPPGGSPGWADSTLATLTLREKVGQMIMPFVMGDHAPEGSPGHDRIVSMIEDHGVGGVIVSLGTPGDVALKLADLQRHARLPLLVGADMEAGAGFRLRGAVHLPAGVPLGGATEFPPPMAVGATGSAEFAFEMGRITALESRAVGVHLPFAPVLDVNSNPSNPIINTRSFGEDPEAVARLGVAFIRGVRAGGAIATAKHFPGHGDTETDSHLDLPRITASQARLDSVELVPFRAAIEAGVGAIMTAHIAVPSLTGGRDVPATLAPEILTGVLRTEAGFEGLVFTDAMDMAAIDARYPRGEAAVRAVMAGADVILMPPQVDEAVGAVLTAVAEGRITEERIDRSVRAILRAKEAMGLHRQRDVDPMAVGEVVGIPAHEAVADEIARRSLTLVRHRGDVLPLPADRSRRVFSLTLRGADDLLAGRLLEARLRDRYPRLVSATVTPATRDDVFGEVALEARRADLVVVSLHLKWSSTAADAPLPDGFVALMDSLAAAGTPHLVVSFGNPYLVAELPAASAHILAWSGAEAAQRAVAEALFTGHFPGRMPIGLPGWFSIGDGTSVATAVVAPERVGMDARVLARLDSTLDAALAGGAAPGAALAIGRHGRLVRLAGHGVLEPVEGTPVTPSTLYDLASLTKVVATTTAVMLLVDDGRLDLDRPVVEHLPEWAEGDPRKARVTVRHLLLHRSGLPPFRPWHLDHAGAAAYRTALAAIALDSDPGTETVYSDLGFMTLAQVVEAVTGRRLDAFVEERIFGPLGMHDTRFVPPPELRPRIAPTEVDTIRGRGVVRGTVHDENADAQGGVAGHAGLFSTAADLAVFAELMLREGSLPPCRAASPDGRPCPVNRPAAQHLVTPETVRLFTRRADSASSRALGWDTPSGRSSAGDFFSAASFGHTGFTGTSLWIDPERDLFVVLLTNRVHPTRDNARHIPLRRAVHDLAATAVVDEPVPPRGSGGGG